jgi:hypothetical protein
MLSTCAAGHIQGLLQAAAAPQRRRLLVCGLLFISMQDLQQLTHQHQPSALLFGLVSWCAVLSKEACLSKEAWIW